MAKGGKGKKEGGKDAKAKGKGKKDGGKEAKGKGKGKGSSPMKKLSPHEIQQIEEELAKIFARKRLSEMDGIYKKITPSGRVILLLPKIHVWEEWRMLPPQPQLCDQNLPLHPENPNDTNPTRDSQRMDYVSPQTFMKPCLLKGVVYLNTSIMKDHEKLYVEVNARLRYNSSGITDPLQPLLSSVVLDFRDFMRLYPMNVDKDIEASELNQRLFKKCFNELPDFKPFPFQFDLSMRPDSIKFNRPGENAISGIIWEATAFIGSQNHIRNDVDTATVEFCKYTYAPILGPESPLRLAPVQSSRRYATPIDSGEVLLEAKLPQDLFYHGDFIPVNVTVTNTSNRLSLSGVIITVEQVIRTYKDTLQEMNIIVAEEYFDPDTPQSGLPMSAKQKVWTRQVFLQPLLEPVLHKHNLLIEGRLSTETEFLASSSIILHPDFVDRSGFFKAPEKLTSTMTEEELQLLQSQGSEKMPLIRKVEPFVLPPLFSEVNMEGKGGKAGKKGKAGKEGKKKGKAEKAGKKNKNKSNAVSLGSPNKGLAAVGSNVSNKKGKGKATKGGKGKGKDGNEKVSPKKTGGPLQAVEKLIHNNIEYALCNREANRAIFVAYDVVVRLNLSLAEGEGVAGHPVIRLPFVLTRKTNINPKSHSGVPEGLFDPPPDPRVSPGGKKGPKETPVTKKSPDRKKKGKK